MRKHLRAMCVLFVTVATTASLTACSTAPKRYSEGHEVLGTAVTVSVWEGPGASPEDAVGRAFREMKEVEAALSPYDASSTISAFNRKPFETHQLPAEALQVMGRVTDLAASGRFSVSLFGVTSLYDFGGEGTVPDSARLADAVIDSQQLKVDAGGRARFAVAPALSSFMATAGASGSPGLDFGGASKGLALDRAAAALGGRPALLSAGSSTLALGVKPDGEQWRIGIEDPRDMGRLIAMISSEGTLSVSTSGDYQLFFEREGVRYHHILDPTTGMPARGLRSLTVFGQMSAMDADILSTALFVMGRDDALTYADANGIGIYLVDHEGRAGWRVPSSGIGLERISAPKR